MSKVYLSTHFTLREMEASQTAARLGIDNRAPEWAIPGLTLLAEEILEPVRRVWEMSFSPSSAWRCLELNRALKSKDTSQHTKAEAVDLELPGISNFELAVWIRDNLVFDQLILECYTPGEPNSGWVHCSLKYTDNRGVSLTYERGAGFTEGLVR